MSSPSKPEHTDSRVDAAVSLDAAKLRGLVGSTLNHISPNSASCERVFSLLKLMWGDQQMSTLADAIRASLMLRYNDRVVG